MMKKTYVVVLSILFLVGMVGCKDTKEQFGPLSERKTYFICYVCDDNGKELYSSSIWDIGKEPHLTIGKEYQLKLHIGPGARLPLYESVQLEFDENDVSITTVPELPGRIYILYGLKSDKNITVKFSAKADSTITCKINLFFDAENAQ